MGFDVIYDPTKEIAALIDPENGRALGPLLSGPEQVTGELFASFAGALNADPASLHPADLDHHFRNFLEVLAEDDETAHAAPAAPGEPAAPAAGGPVSPAADAPVAPADQRPAEAAAPGETGGIAGAPTGTEQAPAAVEGAAASPTAATDAKAAGVVADAGLPTGVENARPGAEGTPGADATPAGSAGGGVPKAPGA